MSQSRHRSLFGFARRLVLVTLVPAVAAAGELHSPATARLDDVVVASQPDVTTIHLKTSGRPAYQAEFLDSPPRVVVDLEETVFAWRPPRLDAAAPPIRQVRGSQFRKGVARVVVELTGPSGYVVRQDAQGIAIVLSSPTTRPATAVRPAAAVLAMETIAPPPAAGDRAPLLLAQARPATPPPAAPSGRLISLDFKDADVVNLLRILAAESGKNIIIADDVKGKMSITLKNVPWEQALDIILEARGLQKVERGNVIRIVSGDQLMREREAAAKMEDARVKAEEAKAKAEAEVRTKAAEASVKEQEAQAKKLALEQQLEEIRSRGPIREETIRLAYADPEEIAKTLIGILGISPGQQLATVPPPVALGAGMTSVPGIGATPLTERPQAAGPGQMSPEAAAKGITIQAHKPTNSIFIRHYEKDVERIKKLIRETLDIQLPQVKIEARLSEMSRTTLLEYGVQINAAGVGKDGVERFLLGQGGMTPAGFTRSVLEFPPTTFQNGPNFSLPDGSPVPWLAPIPLLGNLVNLPTSSAPTGGISFGIIGTKMSINVLLQALEEENKSRTLARPEIVTIDNTKASMTLGTEIGYRTGTAQAGFSVAFKDAALKLEVTPTVIREPDATKIKMKLLVEDNSVGALFDGIPSIAKRNAQTEVVVREGETLVIGGVTQRSETEGTRKVPLFGDIPVLGWLFKSKRFNVPLDRELIVFITPTVLKDTPRGTRPTAPPAPPSR